MDVADRWGRLQAQVSRTLPAIDSLIAATALHYDLMLVTRNINDFIDCPHLETLNPWDILA
jgi:toxin FitB